MGYPFNLCRNICTLRHHVAAVPVAVPSASPHASRSHQEGRNAGGHECQCPLFQIQWNGLKDRLKRLDVHDAEHQQYRGQHSKHQRFVLKRIAVENRTRAAAVKHMDQLRHDECGKGNGLRFGQLVRIIRRDAKRNPKCAKCTQADQYAAADDFPTKPSGKIFSLAPRGLCSIRSFSG